MAAEMVNPYIAGAPVTEARMFFGREDVFEWIRNSLTGQYADHILVIHGQRRVGKTSVLKQLGNRMPTRYAPVFFDLQGRTHTTLDRFLWWLAREIVRVLKQDSEVEVSLPEKEAFAADLEYFENRFLPDLKPALGGRTLLLTFDEFDNLEETDIKETLARPLIDYLRRLMGMEGLNFIFSIGSSGRKLENMRSSYTDFFKTALYKKISFLDQEQARDLIVRPVEGLIEYEQPAVGRILQIAAGHPYFTQLTCHELFSRCQRKDSRRVTRSDVESILDDVVERGTVNLKFMWDEASDLGKWILTSLAALEQADKPALSDFLRRQRVRFSEAEFTSTLLHLREKDVLTPENQFVIYLFQLWLQKNRSPEQAREELTEVNPIANRYIEIGLEYRENKQYPEALDSFQDALRVDNDNIQAQVSIASIYLAQGSHESAITEFEKALALDDEDITARAGLCDSLLALGDAALHRKQTDEALQSYQRLLTINTEHTEARQRIAEIHRQRAESVLAAGRIHEALELFAEAQKFAPEDHALTARIAEVQAEARERDLAALLSRLDAAIKFSRWEEALAALNEYFAAKPVEVEGQQLTEGGRLRRDILLGNVQKVARGLETLEKFDDALETWHKVLALDPEAQQTIESEIVRVELKRDLENSYREAKRALNQGDYALAAQLLKEIVLTDETYKDVLGLLARVTAKRRAVPGATPHRWIRIAALVALIAVFIYLAAVLWSTRAVKEFITASLGGTATPITEAATPIEISVTGTPDLRVLNPTNQHKYLYVKTETTWTQAKDHCASQGGYLATIRDAAEDEYIFQLTSGFTWLGGTDEAEEGTWVWVSGEPWEYTHWDDGEPNNQATENYLSYHWDVDPTHWNDLPDDGTVYYTCEWEPESGTQAESTTDQIRTFAEPILASIANKTPDYLDDFNDPDSGWPTSFNSIDNEYGYLDGAYFMSNMQATADRGNCNGAALPGYPAFSDFVLEVDGIFVNHGDGGWNLLFRDNDTAHYGANVSTGGMFSFYKNIEGAHIPLPKSETSIPSFQSGNAANHLTLIAQGNQMAAYINGEPVSLLTDSSLIQGIFTIGLCGDTPLEVLFDNLKVWDISGISLETSTDQIRSFADPILTAISNKTPDYQDDFSDPASGWPAETTANGDEWGYVDGSYLLTVTRRYRNPSDDPCLDVEHKNQLQFPDFVMEVESLFVNDTPGNLHLIFREIQTYPYINFFTGMYPDGTFFFHKFVDPNQVDILQSLAVPPLLPGLQKNRLTLIARGTFMAAYLNGEPYVLVNDTTWRNGSLMLNFGACNDSETDSLLQVELDDLKVWNITDLLP